MLKANITPEATAAISRCQYAIRSSSTSAPTVPAVAVATACVTRSSSFLFRRSATTPPSGEPSSIGRALAAVTQPIAAAESVSSNVR